MRNILIVEEDVEGRSALARVLRLWGFHVSQTANEADALAVLETSAPFDMIIAGATEQDRAVFLADVRERRPAVPLLFLADYCAAEARLRSMLYGAFASSRKQNYFLNVRPISLYELDRFIRIVLGKRSRRRPGRLRAA